MLVYRGDFKTNVEYFITMPTVKQWSKKFIFGGSGLSFYYFLVFVAYFLVSFFNVTTSSLGGMNYGQDSGGQLGMSRWIRSDEILRSTPYLLGLIRSHGSPDAFSSLDVGSVISSSLSTYSGYYLYPTLLSQPFFYLIIKIGSINLIGFLWFFYIFVFFLAFPALLNRWGIPPTASVIATILTFFSPAVAWWSFTPIQPMAIGALASLFMLLAYNKTNLKFKFLTFPILSGYLFSSMLFLYQRLSIPIAFTFFLITLIFAWTREKSRRVINATLITIFSALFFTAINFVQMEKFWLAQAQTIVPGSLTSGSYLIEISRLLAGPAYLFLQGQRADQFIVSNVSEFSGGYFVLGIIATLLFGIMYMLDKVTLFKAETRVSLFLYWICASWCLFEIPFSSVSPFRYFVPYRLFILIQLLSPLIFFLVLRDSSPALVKYPKLYRVIFFVTLTLTWVGGSSLKQAVPSLRSSEIFLAALFFSLFISWIFVAKFTNIAMKALAFLVICSCIFVNPVRNSLGVYGEEFLPKLLNTSLNELRDRRFALDQKELAAVFNAQAIPTESGQQWFGPNLSFYKTFFPNSANEWNRGASYVTFAFSKDQERVENPAFDIVQIRANPCGKILSSLRITDIISSTLIDKSCVNLYREFYWMGEKRYWYILSNQDYQLSK